MPIILIGQLKTYINRVETLIGEIYQDVKIWGKGCSSDWQVWYDGINLIENAVLDVGVTWASTTIQ